MNSIKDVSEEETVMLKYLIAIVFIHSSLFIVKFNKLNYA